MTRKASLCAALAVIAAAMACGTASVVRAAPTANVICPAFRLNGQKIQWEVIGSWTCASAKPWIVKMDKDHVKPAVGSVPLHNGPRGYHCAATRLSASGQVIDGICYKGTLAFPKSGFTW